MEQAIEDNVELKKEPELIECVVFPSAAWNEFANVALKNLNGETTVTIQNLLIPMMKVKKLNLEE